MCPILDPLMSIDEITKVLERLIVRYPALTSSLGDIKLAYEMLRTCYENGNKVLICGNGGSAADADHIVGELMKSFAVDRLLSDDLKSSLISVSPDLGRFLAEKLQPALPAIALTCHNALNTAFSNDVDPSLIFAQQVIGYGKPGDIIMGISTSGNSANVVHALVAAKAIGIGTIGLTGPAGGRLRNYCDVVIAVPGENVAEIQELHLPVYHAICMMLELNFFTTH